MRKHKPMTAETKAKILASREKNRQAKLAAQESDPNVVPVPAGVEVPHAPMKPLETAIPLEDEPMTPRERQQAEMIQKMQTQIDTILTMNQNSTINKDQAVNEIARMSGTTVGANGVQGQVFRYPVNKDFYPDPTDRLYDDARLKRFAMRENFYFRWDVTGETYEKNNIAYTEPRFTVELFRFMFNDDGEPSGKMFMVGRQYQHEDEFIARLGAERMGLVQGKDYETFDELMNEMRYQRIRTWLLGLFTPVHVNQFKKKSLTMVIDGKAVEVTDTEDVVEQARAVEQAAAIKAQTAVRPI